MSDSNRRDGSALGGLVALGLIVMVAVGGVSFLWGASHAIGARREFAQQRAQSECAQTHEKGCDAAGSGIRGLGADEDAVDVAVWQLWLNIAGLVGLAYTVWYAKRAWGEAKRSADVSQHGLDDARADAAEQERRFAAQLRIARDSLKIAQRAAAEVDRAWLSIDITPISGLRVDEESISIEARVILENVGKGPAIGVESTGELTFNIGDLDQTIRQNTGIRALPAALETSCSPVGRTYGRGVFRLAEKPLRPRSLKIVLATIRLACTRP